MTAFFGCCLEFFHDNEFQGAGDVLLFRVGLREFVEGGLEFVTDGLVFDSNGFGRRGHEVEDESVHKMRKGKFESLEDVSVCIPSGKDKKKERG